MGEGVRRGHAFGLGLEVSFECPGLPPPTDDEHSRPGVRVELARPDDLPASRSRVSPAGYLLAAAGYGTFLVPADGARVKCAPAETAPWLWQRYLVGQVLPLVAVLHRYEVFHASVVALGDGAVAFVGRSGAGKSTIAAALAARGAAFVADDVLVVGTGNEPICAWPGFGLTTLRRDALARLPAGAADRLGPMVGTGEEGVRIAVDVAPGPLPLRCLYFLRWAARGREPRIERVDPVDPRLLLAGSYNLLVGTPERRTRHLDVCARLTRSIACFRVSISPNVGPSDVAAAVEDHAAANTVPP